MCYEWVNPLHTLNAGGGGVRGSAGGAGAAILFLVSPEVLSKGLVRLAYNAFLFFTATMSNSHSDLAPEGTFWSWDEERKNGLVHKISKKSCPVALKHELFTALGVQAPENTTRAHCSRPGKPKERRQQQQQKQRNGTLLCHTNPPRHKSKKHNKQVRR